MVGRAATCDVDLTRYWQHHLSIISRQHFRISYRKGEGFIIIDTSHNGTAVNNQELVKGQPRILRDGDVITLAKTDELLIKVTIYDDPNVTDSIFDPSLLSKVRVKSGLMFDEAAAQFVVDGRPIPHEQLTRLEASLLKYLCDNAGRLCTFDDLALNVWTDPAWTPTNNAISRAVGNVRRKLDQILPGAGDYIQNIRGQGYKVAGYN